MADDTDTERSAPRTARERARRELTAEIKEVGRRHLAEQGTALSLRAVARELGMVSSAVYRYFPSRDDLLTALIVDAYDAVGEVAEAATPPADAGVVARWVALSGAIRGWARANPHEYALIYGSPIPGYRAPVDTIMPAARVSQVFLGLLRDGIERGELVGRMGDEVVDDPAIPAVLQADLAAIRDAMCPGVPDSVVARGLGIWTEMFGTISFELFGHMHKVINDYDAMFELQMTRAAEHLLGRPVG
jgi:AcrR family transcriptional regulator